MKEEFPNAINFTIDSKLLQELGERLVGKHFIALAELIKNSYDADANLVNLKFSDEDGGKIVIHDDGNGMTFNEFKNFWMRIGSRHKERWKKSQKYHRPLTGSKGVGRLSAQLLADEMIIITTSIKKPDKRICAQAKWKDAINAGELTNAKAMYREENGTFNPGTKIILTKLRKTWTEKDFKELAKELWQLVPPFKGMKKEERFDIKFESDISSFEKRFKNQMKAILNDYYWKIVGKNEDGKVITSFQFEDNPPINYEFEIHPGDKDGLKNGIFEIRIYKLWGRQKHGLLIDDVREYLFDHGGVHIYDSGFHLPYYGDPRNDWIGILTEHARRLQKSKLLPEELQVGHGLQYLPGSQRILGIVRINTGEEPNLKISITRDRLIENQNYFELRKMMRFVMHHYAMLEAKKQYASKEIKEDIEEYYPKFEKIEDLVDNYRGRISEEIYNDIKENIRKTKKKILDSEEKLKENISLMGALATAGISSIAHQHEIGKQLLSVENIVEDIDIILKKDTSTKDELIKIKNSLIKWYEKAKGINKLYEYFMDAESFENKDRYNARDVVSDIISQTKKLAGDIKPDNKISDELLLPKASLIEWTSIFQNVLTNAYNALDKSKKKSIEIIDRGSDKEHEILIMDTGSEVDIKSSDELFLPFKRKIKLSPDKKKMGYGGSGMGLTIVKFISDRIGIKVGFVNPPDGFNTAFSIKWSEK